MRNTRSDLLVEAETLIRRSGYSAFSYADLAETVGISKASIHHHFPTKAKLALALLAAYDERYDTELAAIETRCPGAADRIEAYAALYMEGAEKGLGCLCAAFVAEHGVLPEQLGEALSVFFGKHVAWVERTLATGRREGSIRPDIDPGTFARLVVSALEGALMMERAVDGPAGFGTTVRALMTCLRPASRSIGGLHRAKGLQ